LALVTSVDVFGDVFANGRPIVFGEDEISGSTNPRVSCEWVIMVLLDDFLAERIVFRDIEKIFVR